MTRQRPRRGPLVVVAAVLTSVVLAIGLAGCGDTDEKAISTADDPRPLNGEQAQALGLMRFVNYTAGRIRLSVTAAGSVAMKADVVVDLNVGVGYGTYEATDPTTADDLGSGLIAWSTDQIGTAAGDDPARVPTADAWTQRSLDRTQPVDVALALALQLGSDRPENPQLLAQSSARLLRIEGKGDDRVFVMTGPGTADGKTESHTTYWVDPTGHLKKMEARIGGQPAVFTVEESPIAEPLPGKVLRFLRRNS